MHKKEAIVKTRSSCFIFLYCVHAITGGTEFRISLQNFGSEANFAGVTQPSICPNLALYVVVVVFWVGLFAWG